MHEQVGDQVTIIGVAGRDDESEAQAFVDNLGVGSIDHIFDDDGSIWSEFGVTSQPSWAFIDANGNVSIQFGALGEMSLLQRIDDLLAAA